MQINCLKKQELHVLIIDDEPLARERLRNLLKKQMNHITINEVGNGADAVLSINSNPPDVLFLDIEIPDKNGFEVLDSIECAEGLQVVFVTAYHKYLNQINTIKNSQYLLKPFDERKFVTVFKNLVHALSDKKQ